MVYSEKQYAYYLELARIACSPSSFVGSDMRYSSEFEVLEAELGKAHSIHGAGLPDWQKISEISECILREHSKDLRVAAWLAWALYQRDSFAGLLAGLGVLRELCEHHWAQVYPVKLRTRIAAFGWLSSSGLNARSRSARYSAMTLDGPTVCLARTLCWGAASLTAVASSGCMSARWGDSVFTTSCPRERPVSRCARWCA